MTAGIHWVPLSAAVCHGLSPALLYGVSTCKRPGYRARPSLLVADHRLSLAAGGG
jgi:hypothetical protein